MKFNISERLRVFAILPLQGDVATLRTIQELRNEFSFTDEEESAIGLKINPTDGRATWKPEADFEKDIPLGDSSVNIICEALSELNRKKLLHITYLELYDRFMKEKESRDKEKK